MQPVVIVGAGPAGLATAACLKRSGIRFALLDRTGAAGGSFRTMPRGMKLLSPRRYVHLPYLPYPGSEDYPGIPEYESYLENYAGHFGLTPERREIAEVRRTPEGFEVRCVSSPALSCRFVVIATGLFSHPVWPEIAGLTPGERGASGPVVLHARDWTGPDSFAGRRVLVIGAGISGVAAAEECARAGVRVLVSRRSGRTRLVRPRWLGLDVLHWFRPLEFLPRSWFGSLCRQGIHAPAYDNGYRAFVAAGKITELPEVKQVQGTTVRCADGTRHDADVIIAATGYRYATPFLPSAVSRAPGGHPLADGGESPDWPGLFFVGAPCARRIDSEFLRGIASDAVEVAGRIGRRFRLRRISSLVPPVAREIPR